MFYRILPHSLATTMLVAGSLDIGLPHSASATQVNVSNALQQADGLVLDLKAGEVLEIVLPKNRIGHEARKARRTFERIVRPEMEKQAFDYVGELGVEDVIIGSVKPSAVEFYTYKSASLKARLEDEVNWEELQDYRSEGWKRRDIFSTVLPSDLSIRFDPSKSYTLAVAWTNPARPEDYDRYLDAVSADFEAVGARFVHRFRGIDYKTQSDDRKLPPAQMIFVEWDDKTGLNRLLTSESYKEHSQLFQSGISDFRFYRLSSPAGS